MAPTHSRKRDVGECHSDAGGKAKLTRYMATLEAELASVQGQLVKMEEHEKEAQRLKDGIANNNDRIEANTRRVVQMRRTIRRMQRDNSQLLEENICMRSRESELINELERPTVERLVERSDASPPPPPPSSYGLSAVYGATFYCSICMSNRDGGDVVYMGCCTHQYCKVCIDQVKKQHVCMDCRAEVSAMYCVIQDGDRHRIKSFPAWYNFREDRILSVEERRTRLMEEGLTALEAAEILGEGLGTVFDYFETGVEDNDSADLPLDEILDGINIDGDDSINIDGDDRDTASWRVLLTGPRPRTSGLRPSRPSAFLTSSDSE